MTSVGKANGFMEVCKASGWETKWKAANNYEFVEVTATRGGEKVVIAWINNQLNGPPEYFFNGVLTKLHSAAVAKRTVQAAKPDIAAYQRRARRTATVAGAPGTAPESSSAPLEIDPTEYTLPFNIHEDLDSVILKAIRGNTIIWRNSMTRAIMSEYVPHKAGDKVFNWDTKNVFYLATTESGRDYVSYMNVNGVFRAVALETLVGVI